ncbi:MAG: LysR substrate-binding domain-containing protein, partial [Sutterella sp.]|nr:LysR substrate-binding domain-containing protein [Sutterella sp.]
MRAECPRRCSSSECRQTEQGSSRRCRRTGFCPICHCRSFKSPPEAPEAAHRVGCGQTRSRQVLLSGQRLAIRPHPHLKEYRRIEPRLEFELLSECDHEDILSGRADLALLPYRPPARDLVLWSVGVGMNLPLASPEYLKTFGTPHTLEELAGHAVIVRSGRNDPVSVELCRGSERRPFVYKKIAFAGDAICGKAAALLSCGIATDL